MNISVSDYSDNKNVLGGMHIGRASSGNLYKINPIFMQTSKKLEN